MAEQYYLIKGETLTNIADTMRNVFGINEEFRGDQIATRIAGEVDNVYDSAFDDGYAEGLVDGSLNSNGTVGVWEFYDNLVIPEEFWGRSFYFGFSFISFGRKDIYNEVYFYNDGSGIAFYYGDDLNFDDVYSGEWNSNATRIISVLEEPLDEEFIEWLKANARRMDSDETYEKGFEVGENVALSALYDVQVITTASGFYVYVYNYHPSYALHILVEVEEANTGATDYAEFDVPPNGEDEYDSGYMGAFGSSVEWNINIYGVEWKK